MSSSPPQRSMARSGRPRLVVVMLAVFALVLASCSITDALTLEDPNDTRPERPDVPDEGADPDSDDPDGEGSPADPGGQREDEVFPNAPGPGQSFQIPGPHPALSELGGQLAVTDGADVAVMFPNGAQRRIVDGSSVREVVASQPVWSNGGALLAWSAFGPDEQSVAVLDATDAEPKLSDATGQPVYYLQWASDDLGLVYLRNGEQGGVEAGTVQPGEPVVPLSTGQPFFVSWAPDRNRLAAHVGAAGSAPGVLSLFEPSIGGASLPVVGETAPFTAPDWLDSSTLIAASSDGLVRIDVPTGESTVLVPSISPVQFVVSPDRGSVAYRGRTESSPSDQPPPLMVLDLASGRSTVVVESDAVAWEWSPDGQRLAVLTTASAAAGGGGVSEISTWPAQSDETEQGRFQWVFWATDGQVGEIYGATPAHEPSSLEVTSYLPFFEQYAQSHHRWSPDSSAFAFAGTITAPDGEIFQGIYVQITDDPSTFSRISSGDHVTWSTAGLAAGVSPA